jgi:hypothetical protein
MSYFLKVVAGSNSDYYILNVPEYFILSQLTTPIHLLFICFRSIRLGPRMTFEQLEKKASIYVNKYGTMFTSYPETDVILVTCNIDNSTEMDLLKPARILATIFNNPDSVGFSELFDHLHPCNTSGCNDATTANENAVISLK